MKHPHLINIIATRTYDTRSHSIEGNLRMFKRTRINIYIYIYSNNPCSIRYVNSPECTTLPLMLHLWAHYYNPEPELRAFWRDSVTKLYTGRVCYHFPIQPLSLPIPPDISLPAAPTNPRFSFHDKFQRSRSRSVSLPKIKVWNFFRSPGELDSELF